MPYVRKVANEKTSPAHLQQSVKPVSYTHLVLRYFNNNWSPQHLPPQKIAYLTYVTNAIFRLKHAPSSWNILKLINNLKPGKTIHKRMSYWSHFFWWYQSSWRKILKRIKNNLEKQEIHRWWWGGGIFLAQPLCPIVKCQFR